MRSLTNQTIPALGTPPWQAARHRTASLLAGLGMLACAPAAQAITGDVTVWWNTLRIEVVDTDLNDGIVPQLTWLSQTTSSFAFRETNLPLNAQADDWITPGGLSFSDATLQFSTHFDANALNVQAASSGGTESATRVYRSGQLQLSGAGRVTFSVDMEAHVFASPAELAWHGGPYGQVWPYADANLFFADSRGNSLSPVAYLRADLDTWGTTRVGTLSTSMELAAGQAVYLMTQPGVVLNPVPEPQTWALLLVGLGMISARRIRTPGARGWLRARNEPVCRQAL